MTKMDPRIAARRAEVREVSARKDVRKVLGWMGVVAVLAVGAWVAQLPGFRVQHIDVSGANRADVGGAVARSGAVLGRPLVLVWAPTVEAALVEDPWIVDVDVSQRFPDTVVVDVVERRPVVTIYADGRAVVVADDGVVVSHTADATLAVAHLSGLAPGVVGEPSPDRRAGEIAAFVSALPPRLAVAMEIREEGGELLVDIAGAHVRLGRAVDMAAKATTLSALLDEGVPTGATIHLVAAQRPAVELPPDEAAAAEGEDVGGEDAEGGDADAVDDGDEAP
jgi:cell division protein FtsQ